MRTLTPLRYPGGKAHLDNFFASLITVNRLGDGCYCEPYAGGAGIAIALLLGDFVDTIVVNDIEPGIHAFWISVVHHNKDLRELILKVPLTVAEWQRQRSILRRGQRADHLQLGFAAFYLNRTNRSGIPNGGLIGGKKQTGPWKMDARFNREDLAARINRIGRYASRIQVFNQDAMTFLKSVDKTLPTKTLLYFDPPYYEKGQHLYANHYQHDDHVAIAKSVTALRRRWVVSYDDHPAIRQLYRGFRRRRYSLPYTARERREGQEIMFFAENLSVPRQPNPASKR